MTGIRKRTRYENTKVVVSQLPGRNTVYPIIQGIMDVKISE